MGQCHTRLVAKYMLIGAAVRQAQRLIGARQYALDSDWGPVQPGADALNDYRERHAWQDYAASHRGTDLPKAHRVT
jgi:hypothetical protein